MRRACAHVVRMGKHLQVRNVEAGLHRKLKRRATTASTTLSDYVKALLKHEVAQPKLAELSAKLRRLAPATLDPAPEDLIRQDRDSR
jgi:plasmid stability protein